VTEDLQVQTCGNDVTITERFWLSVKFTCQKTERQIVTVKLK